MGRPERSLRRQTSSEKARREIDSNLHQRIQKSSSHRRAQKIPRPQRKNEAAVRGVWEEKFWRTKLNLLNVQRRSFLPVIKLYYETQKIIKNFKSISKGESTTGFSTHYIENNHTFSKDKINLLHPGRKEFRLNLLEHLEIRRGLKTGKFVTNDQTMFDSSILVSPLS